ncbi:hypothetical protein JHU04_001123 [Brenneria sp. 4F2]|nr:hypothetical protein [Brenneria bubanii]
MSGKADSRIDVSAGQTVDKHDNVPAKRQDVIYIALNINHQSTATAWSCL